MITYDILDTLSFCLDGPEKVMKFRHENFVSNNPKDSLQLTLIVCCCFSGLIIIILLNMLDAPFCLEEPQKLMEFGHEMAE